MQGVDIADQMVRIIQGAEKSWNVPRNYVIFAIGGSPKQFNILQKALNIPKSKERCVFKDSILDCYQKMTDPAHRENENDRADD